MQTQIYARVARTLAALDHGAAAPVDAVPPSVRRVAALLGCSVEAAAYIDALETRVAALEGKVAELRHASARSGAPPDRRRPDVEDKPWPRVGAYAFTSLQPRETPAA